MYARECETTFDIASLHEWIYPAVEKVLSKDRVVSQMELDIAVGLEERAEFFSMY